MSYYAVRTGRQTGVYRTWEDCKEQVHRFPSARYKKFNSKQAAWNFVNSEDSAGPSSGYGSNTWYEKPSFSGYKRSYQQSSSSEDEEYEPKHAKYRAVTYTSDNLQLAYTGMTKWVHKWNANDWRLSTGEKVMNKKNFKKLEKLSKGMDSRWGEMNPGVWTNSWYYRNKN
ncbi:ribonuclease H1-like isoform X1 [Rhinatrema bivittatum]|uniref:ribonuclease H1-like isoform X1 n=1 Tax=Rhinatrema bivittatum TaxID=194408 RepID=UPI00112882B5|nr:ribonuclease H1-like isoform X1 [Rhinatrema bivittatum]